MANSNQRLYYPVLMLSWAPDGSSSYTEMHGVQNCGVTTNFNLTQYFQLGQSALYENKESYPEVQLTVQKNLDGYPLLYHAATYGASSASLNGRSRTKTSWMLSTFDDTYDSASGVPLYECVMSGLFCNSVSYSFNVNGAFTEDITLIGYNKFWYDRSGGGQLLTGQFNNTDQPKAISNSGGVQERVSFMWDRGTGVLPTALDANGMVNATDFSILPPQINGISSSGTNPLKADGSHSASVQSITANVDLNRQELFELGRKTPYFRYVQLPVQVSCSITTIAKSYDGVSATEDGILGNGNNLTDYTIKIKTKEGTFINLGLKNKLASVDMNGGDTGGGITNLTYNYNNFNDFIVQHPQDPTTALRIS